MADCRLSGNGYALSVAKSVIDKGIVKTVMGDLGQTVPVLRYCSPCLHTKFVLSKEVFPQVYYPPILHAILSFSAKNIFYSHYYNKYYPY